MILLKTEQMRIAEQEAVRYGMNELRLMENAGAAAAKVINDEFAVLNKRVAVVCGFGNNGGDGYVVARKLKEYGAEVSVIRAFGLPQTKQANQMCLRVMEISVQILDYTDSPANCNAVLLNADIIVDAVFGLGFKGEVDAKTADMFDLITKSDAKVASIDLPSGVYSCGNISHNAVVADLTVTFQSYKPCHIYPFSLDICGKVRVVSIGIPDEIIKQFSDAPKSINFDECIKALPKRLQSFHKGNCGTALIIAGSKGLAGAAVLAARAALKSGVGLVKVACPESVYPIIATAVPEVVTVPLDENEIGTISIKAIPSVIKEILKSDGVLIGPGLGVNYDTEALVREVILNCTVPLVIDADGLNVISRSIDIIEQKKAEIIMTPHPKEFSKLTGKTVGEIEGDRFLHAKTFAERYNINLVLKGRYTIVANSNEVVFNTTGNSGMATAGSGDMLGGIAVSLLAQSMSAKNVAKAAVSIHAAAGDLAKEYFGERSMTVSDMINQLPILFKNT